MTVNKSQLDRVLVKVIDAHLIDVHLVSACVHVLFRDKQEETNEKFGRGIKTQCMTRVSCLRKSVWCHVL